MTIYASEMGTSASLSATVDRARTSDGSLKASPIRLVYVGDVPSEPTGGGSMLLHRHLEGARSEFSVDIPSFRAQGSWGMMRRLAALLGRRGYRRQAETLYGWINGRWAEGQVERLLRAVTGQTVILTVAHGDLCYTAARCARDLGLPLVTLFHDWWPDTVPLTPSERRRADRRFTQLHRDSTVSLPVSAGMQRTLGAHPAAEILYPIPQASRPKPADYVPSGPEKPFRVLYAGNLAEYGPMVADALRESLKYPNLRLEVRGKNPAWPEDFRQDMKQRGLWLEFAPRDQLETWFQSADAYLVTMEFKPNLRRSMETSFPSKLAEYTHYARPLVIWGPDYCSAAEWSQNGSKALSVSQADPSALCTAIHALASSIEEQKRYSSLAAQVAKNEFCPRRIQDIFVKSVRYAASAFPRPLARA